MKYLLIFSFLLGFSAYSIPSSETTETIIYIEIESDDVIVAINFPAIGIGVAACGIALQSINSYLDRKQERDLAQQNNNCNSGGGFGGGFYGPPSPDIRFGPPSEWERNRWGSDKCWEENCM